MPEVSHPSEFYIDSARTSKAENVPCSRKITLKTVPGTFSIIWNPRLWKHRGHAGACAKTNAQTARHKHQHTHTASAVKLIFFPARRSRLTRLTPHPGCRGFSRPLGDSADREEKHTTCKTSHNNHPTRSDEAANIHISILPSVVC